MAPPPFEFHFFFGWGGGGGLELIFGGPTYLGPLVSSHAIMLFILQENDGQAAQYFMPCKLEIMHVSQSNHLQ